MMFCNKCGCRIQDDSQFCAKCGAHLVPIEEKQLSIQDGKKDLDREAIKIYLRNVLALEYALATLKRKWTKVNQEIRDFESSNYREIITISDKEKLGLLYDGSKYYMHFNVGQDGKAFIGLKWGAFYKISWLSIDEEWEYINHTANWPSTYKSGSSILDMLLVAPIVESSQQRAKKKKFLEAYESFKSRAPKRYTENLRIIQPKIDLREGIKKEFEDAKKILFEAYDINIVPQQFRNIYAIWFIHNYISSSNETLTSAFLHCDLDSIKNKLDTIIEQQREIIMNQSILAAQNKQLMEQNQQSLKHLAAIERNTEMASQYSQIAANNAEACAWIGVANYLR